MKLLVSFVGRLQEYLKYDLRCYGLIEAQDPESPLSFTLLPLPIQPNVAPMFGAMGLTKYHEWIIVALQWYNPSFLVLDREFKRAANPRILVEDVHSIMVFRDHLLATETLRDSVVSFGLPEFDNRAYLYSFETGDNKHHLNSVAINDENQILIAFHRDPIGSEASAVVVNLTTNELVDLPERIKRLHSLEMLDGNLAFCDSIPYRVWTGTQFVDTIGYARGLAGYGDYLVAGSSRISGGDPRFPGQCAVQVFNYKTGRLVNQLLITERWEIFDILVLE